MDVLHAQALLMSTRRRQQAREHESNEEGEERRAAVVNPVTGQEGGGTLTQGGEGVGTWSTAEYALKMPCALESSPIPTLNYK